MSELAFGSRIQFSKFLIFEEEEQCKNDSKEYFYLEFFTILEYPHQSVLL